MSKLVECWGWSAESPQPVAAYVHVPFCRHRCGYCNFSLLANREDLFDRFLDALEKELHWLESARPVQTIFIGGGTPSILSTRQLIRLFAMLGHWLPAAGSANVGHSSNHSDGIDLLRSSTIGGIAQPALSTIERHHEWSIESNPLDITPEFCRTCVSHGVDRISIGGQSFQAPKLRGLERDHSPEQLREAIDIAKSHFSSVSVDLIFGAPGESLNEWMADLQSAASSGVDHISTYGLTYEKGAKFWSLKEKGVLQPVEEEAELSMYLQGIDYLATQGFVHYEVSNFCKPGRECLHNKTYWQGNRWWAFGPSAARFVGDTRSVNHRGTIEYLKRLEQDESPVSESERLDADQMLRERFVFGMRQRAGVPWETWRLSGPQQTVSEIDALVAKHIGHGWLEIANSQLRLTRQGLVVSDSLWSEYL